MSETKVAKIAVVGAGWWSQGWHLPHLSRNPKSEIAAIVDTATHPKSSLEPNLVSLETLQEQYKCPTYPSVQALFDDKTVSDSLDGVIVVTPHVTHSEIGNYLMEHCAARESHKPLHILMEKPMTTNVDQAKALYDEIHKTKSTGSVFLLNHTANYIPQARAAHKLVQEGHIGEIQHITGFMASPLSWIFEDPTNKGWNEPTPGVMLGNGFVWGQSSHLFAWIYHVCGSALQPQRVFCSMHHSKKTGADVSHAASIECNNHVTMSISGTSLLPGNAHSDPPVGKHIEIKIYGTKGAILYQGDDRNPQSGRLEFRMGTGEAEDEAHEGSIHVHCEDLGFQFEDLDQNGIGPQSLQEFLSACLGEPDIYKGADIAVGMKVIQTLDAMYRSEASKMPEPIAYKDLAL